MGVIIGNARKTHEGWQKSEGFGPARLLFTPVSVGFPAVSRGSSLISDCFHATPPRFGTGDPCE
jgi:hypothetical protein